MSTQHHSTSSIPDPFAEIERRHEAEWMRLLLAEPDLLEESLNAPPEGPPAPTHDRAHEASVRGAREIVERGGSGTPPQNIIRCWDEIPDVLAVTVPGTEWMVPGIPPRASVTLLAGEPGSYKTWLALALLRGVASGGDFLGRRCARAGVLYLDRENPLAVVRERLAVLGVESLSGSRIWGGWLPDAPPAIGDIRTLEIARQLRPLIVFDSLIRFHGSDENSATEMALVMQELRALANAGATVVALHHKPKSEGTLYRGSSDIAGGVDTALAISRDRSAGLLRLECFKSRFAEEFSLTLRPDLSGAGDFVITAAPEAETERSDVEKLAEAIRLNPGQPKERVVELSGVRRGRARALLDRFSGQLWRSQPGPRHAILYFPTGLAENQQLGTQPRAI